MQSKTSVKPFLKKNGIVCDDCWQGQTEYACGHFKQVDALLKMCKAHRKLDSYFVDYQMRTIILEEKCSPCAKKDEKEEWGRREKEMERVRKEQRAEQEKREREQRAEQEKRDKELQRLKSLSDEDFEKEMKEVEERVIGKPKLSMRDVRSGKLTPRSFWELKDKENHPGL
jgi:hypothetical protein